MQSIWVSVKLDCNYTRLGVEHKTTSTRRGKIEMIVEREKERHIGYRIFTSKRTNTH